MSQQKFESSFQQSQNNQKFNELSGISHKNNGSKFQNKNNHHIMENNFQNQINQSQNQANDNSQINMVDNSLISYKNLQNESQRKMSNQSFGNNINGFKKYYMNSKQNTESYTDDQQIRFRQDQTPQKEEQAKQAKNNVNYDTILTQTGFGKYQLYFYMIMIFLGMAEGSQVSIFTLLIPILKNEWNVPDFLNSFSASIVFVGALFGSLLAGKFSDKYGRRTPFMYSTGLTVFLQLFQAFCLDIYQLIIVRGILGILVGFFGPLGVTFTSEFTPSQNRGRYMSLIQVSIAVGQIFGLLIGYMTLDGNLQFGHWRILIVLCSSPGILAWLGGYFFLDESPLFCLANRQYDKCFEILERINDINGKEYIQNIDEKTKEQLIKWSKSSHKEKQTGSFKDLYKGKYKDITFIIWANWFSIMFVYYGIVLMMPYILSKMPVQESSSITNNDIAVLGIQGVSDMVGAAIASYLIEIPGFGRRNNMIINLLISGFVSIILYYYQGYQLFFIATIDRFFLSMTCVFAYQFTSEIYPTYIRTTGVGTANAVGKIGGCIMPIISIYLSSINLFAPFLLYGVLQFLTAILNTRIKKDTIGKSLDDDGEDEDSDSQQRDVQAENDKQIIQNQNKMLSFEDFQQQQQLSNQTSNIETTQQQQKNPINY